MMLDSNLYDNQLSGTLPSSIGSLVNLRFLYVDISKILSSLMCLHEIYSLASIKIIITT